MSKNDRGFFAARSTTKKSDDGIWETAKVILQALAIAFFVRTFLFQPFNIPSSSMYPTLKIGDYLFVSKLSYGYSKYSFNFGFSGFSEKPLISCCSFVNFDGRKVLADTPKQGQVAVFKYPRDLNVDYIKRVIGLPGDRIRMRQGVLYINDVEVKKVKVEDYIDPDGESGMGPIVPQFEETLPNGVKYRVLDMADTVGDTTEEYVVPAGHYFMMGDNRDNSQDSRYLDKVGYVPLENFVGRADVIFFSFQKSATLFEPWKWPFQIRWSRFFNWIQSSS
jgi:signal peptidase I